MPRKITSRRWHGRDARQETLDPAIVNYLISGGCAAAFRDMKARGVPPSQRFRVWLVEEMVKDWRQHREAIVREADRRGVAEPFGARYDAPDHDLGAV